MRFRLILAIPFVLATASAVWSANTTGITSAALAEAERMARAGSVVAQTYLGLAHDIGEGVPQNPSTAARWYQMAADQGNADAQMFLGSAYLEGRGVDQDLANALLWLDLAAKTLHGEDKATCDGLLEQAVWSASPDQLSAAQRRAAEWQPKPAARRRVTPLSAKSMARRLRYQATLADLQ